VEVRSDEHCNYLNVTSVATLACPEVGTMQTHHSSYIAFSTSAYWEDDMQNVYRMFHNTQGTFPYSYGIHQFLIEVRLLI
jgi:hypothetical protein